jgi:dihydrofolate reductase
LVKVVPQLLCFATESAAGADRVPEQKLKDHTMRKLIMWNLITIDSYFEGTRNWDLPWHEQVWGEELERFSLEQLGSADLLLFGRVTYEGMAAYWQTAQGDIADYMNSLPKVVCSCTLQVATWNNTTLVKDNVAGEVARLKQQGNGNIFVLTGPII